jgi:hypothetical protein
MASKDSFSTDLLLQAALGGDWCEVYAQSVRVLDQSDDPDAIFMECCDRLANDLADVFLQVARDAAGDLTADDSVGEGAETQLIDTGYTLFAIPVLVLPTSKPSAEDFDILAACLRGATGGDDVFIVPEVVSAEDFLVATPDALRFAVSTIDWNRTFGHDLDALEHIVDRDEKKPETLPRLSSVIIGARIETFVGGTEFVPANWVSDCPDDIYERFRNLLKEHGCAFATAERPMSAGRIVPTLGTRLKLEDVINEIATIGNELGVLPDVLIYEDDKEGKTFISLSVEGHPLSDTVIDRRGSSIEAGDMAGMLRTFVPDVAETRDARVFTRSVVTDEKLN